MDPLYYVKIDQIVAVRLSDGDYGLRSLKNDKTGVYRADGSYRCGELDWLYSYQARKLIDRHASALA